MANWNSAGDARARKCRRPSPGPKFLFSFLSLLGQNGSSLKFSSKSESDGCLTLGDVSWNHSVIERDRRVVYLPAISVVTLPPPLPVALFHKISLVSRRMYNFPFSGRLREKNLYITVPLSNRDTICSVSGSCPIDGGPGLL